jgi:hypothetical protein
MLLGWSAEVGENPSDAARPATTPVVPTSQAWASHFVAGAAGRRKPKTIVAGSPRRRSMREPAVAWSKQLASNGSRQRARAIAAATPRSAVVAEGRDRTESQSWSIATFLPKSGSQCGPLRFRRATVATDMSTIASATEPRCRQRRPRGEAGLGRPGAAVGFGETGTDIPLHAADARRGPDVPAAGSQSRNPHPGGRQISISSLPVSL